MLYLQYTLLHCVLALLVRTGMMTQFPCKKGPWYKLFETVFPRFFPILHSFECYNSHKNGFWQSEKWITVLFWAFLLQFLYIFYSLKYALYWVSRLSYRKVLFLKKWILDLETIWHHLQRCAENMFSQRDWWKTSEIILAWQTPEMDWNTIVPTRHNVIS